MLCRVIEISRAGYYAWKDRSPSAHEREDADLTERIRSIFHGSRATYGAPRIQAELAATDIHVARKRVARLMRQAGLAAKRWTRRGHTTTPDPSAAPAPNIVDRNFTPPAADHLWAVDMTYIPTWQGWLYLAIVLDCFSRRVVGWALADHLHTDLPLQALRMALQQRRPRAHHLVHHSDRGCQYTSVAYRCVLAANGITVSMSRSGNALDNAVAESFFATLKCELLHDRIWATRPAAEQAVFEWIEVFYNRRRRHSAIGYMTPAAFEAHSLQRRAA